MFLKDQETQVHGVSTMDEDMDPVLEDQFEAMQGEQEEHRPKKRKSLGYRLDEKNKILKSAVEHLKSIDKTGPDRDDAAVFGVGWACLFRKLSTEQQFFAKKVIDEVFINGQLNTLKINSMVTTPTSTPVWVPGQDVSQTFSYTSRTSTHVSTKDQVDVS